MNLIVAYLGVLLVLAVALNARTIGEFLGIMDHPDAEAHKTHALPTPLVGTVMLALLAVFIILNNTVFGGSLRFVGISVGTILMAMIGFFDDRLRLSWSLRLLLITVVVAGVVAIVPQLQFANFIWSFGSTTPFSPTVGFIVSVACLTTIVVAFNMMDGFNGGVIGVSLVLFIVMALVASSPHRQAICLFIASALGVMFLYNMKGEFFLGDGGAYALGFLVGSTATLTYTMGATFEIYADTIFVWLALPALDCLRVIVARARVGGSKPFESSRDHLHHVLMRRWGPKRTLLFFICYVGAFSLASLYSGKYTALLIPLQIVTLIIFAAPPKSESHKIIQ